MRGGKEYFDRLEKMIDDAVETIHLQVYILNNDQTGSFVAHSLERAAARGVKIFMLVDGYASQSLPHEFIEQIRAAGIQFRFFEPLLKSHNFYFGRRLHHKVIVTDSRYCMVGGINIADRYNDLPGEAAWMDWGIFAEGEVAAELFLVCEELWEKLDRGKKFAFQAPALPASLLHEKCLVRVRRNDWVRKYNEVSGSYIEMFAKAEDQITIMSSYFLPGRVIRKKMEAAARRGVKIRLVLTGYSDVPITKHAERYIYRWIFKNKIRLYEYQKNVLHGKLSTYDDKWVTAGSYNVNFISAYASIELNLDIADNEFTVSVNKAIEKIIREDCVEIMEKNYNASYGFFSRILNRVSYDVIQFVFFLFTFYFRPKRE